MNLPNELLEKIANRYTCLRGTRRKYGLSPFRSERHPSFVIFPDGYYHDFGTGEHGDAIDLVMRMENLTFSEAVSFIEREFGINLPFKKSKIKNKKERTYQEALRRIGWTPTDRLRYLEEDRVLTYDIVAEISHLYSKTTEIEDPETGRKATVFTAETIDIQYWLDGPLEEYERYYKEEKRRIYEDRRAL